ncbi:hypothetical protein P7C73_g3948, partial [Tremellales sp. Uapishka_1]
MPALQSKDKILVTGGSGFIAAHVCKTLLEQGHPVRTTVRNDSKGLYLKELFQGKGDFEYVIVEDIGKVGFELVRELELMLAQPHCFDEAVTGVEGIAHTASPFYLNAGNAAELIDPAVQGTVGLLQSALDKGSAVKRIVVTSSVAAIMMPKTGAFTFTEECWNTESPEVIEKEGDKASGPHMYRASKTLAERAAWNFCETNQPNWDLVVVNPPFAFGPIIHQVDKPEQLNTSVATFYAYTHGQKTEADLGGSPGNWADVRDIAYGHFRALVVPEASGERFILASGPFSSQGIVDVIHSFVPEVKGVPIGKPGSGKEVEARSVVFSSEKAQKVLGVDFMSFEKCLLDMHHSLEQRFT